MLELHVRPAGHGFAEPAIIGRWSSRQLSRASERHKHTRKRRGRCWWREDHRRQHLDE